MPEPPTVDLTPEDAQRVPAHAEPHPSSGDRFTILHLHAKGGLGQVSVARDEKLKRQVALKEIRPDKRENLSLRQRFLTEAEITGQLEHPGIVPIYDLDVDANGQVRYAMRFVQGRTLGDAIRAYHAQPTPLAFRALLQRFLSVCQTIGYAHSQGVIHRDLKPANVLLGDFGETLVVDWGLAKRLRPHTTAQSVQASPKVDSGAAPEETIDLVETPGGEENLTQAGQVLGTPAYMAPEQASGDIEAIRTPADLYGLGAMLYELLTGRPPYQGKNAAEVLTQVGQGRLVRPTQVRKGVPPALEAICLKAMAHAVSQRYSSATELVRDVERWLADEPVTAYREPLRIRFARWRRRHRTPVIAAAVLVLTALAVAGVSALLAGRERERTQALGRVEALREATPAAVPILLSNLDVANADVRARLRQLWDQQDLPAGQQQRVGLALLPVDSAAVRSRLLALMLQTDNPLEFLLLRDGLAPHMRGSIDALWDELKPQPAANESRHFRVFVALAAFDTESANWPGVADRLTEQLLTSNSLHVGTWSQALMPVRKSLIPALGAAAKKSRTSEKGLLATRILTQYAADQPDVLLELLLGASPQQYEVLWPTLPPASRVIEAMQLELSKVALTQASDSIQDALAARQANAAITLLRLGKADSVWPLLRTSPEPRLRTYLIHRFAALQLDPDVLRQRLPEETDASARQALFLSLGEYGVDRLSSGVREEVRTIGLAHFRDDADPGVHSATDWLLQRLGHGKEIAAAEKSLVSNTPAPTRRWYVNSEGHTMAVVPGPTVFLMSKYVKDREILRPQKIPLSFAIATRKVTLSQFRRFLRDHPDPEYAFGQPTGQDAREPAIQVTWLQAARYCRWLSEQQKIPENQMCYPEIKDIQEGMKLPVNYRQRTGYRLPTSAEWECACRAGAVTRFAYGSDPELLRHYGWHADNSGRRSRPVGLLKPNDLGLFDIYGLAFDWCDDRIEFSPGVEERVYRGSTRFLELEDVATSAPGIMANRPNYRGNECGMRVVQTLR